MTRIGIPKKARVPLAVSGSSLVAGVILYFLRPDAHFLLTSDEFVVTYFGILLGLDIAVVSLIVPVVDRILEKLYVILRNAREGKQAFHNLTPLINELKDDTLFTFYLFVISLGTLTLKHVRWTSVNDLSLLSINAYDLVQLTAVILSLVIILDVLLGMFRVLEMLLFLMSRLPRSEE